MQDPILAQYVETALWSSTDDHGTPLDDRYGIEDIDPGTLDSMRAELAAFMSANAALLADIDPEQAAHDFWLTRNRHGAGFWDRGNAAIGEALTDAAEAYGTVDLYVGDDGKLYVAP